MTQLSIISTSFNDSQYASELYSSLQPHLKRGEWEWIIVDDGSELKHHNSLKEFASNRQNTRFIRIDNSGPAIARDTGIEAARSEYLLVIDIDDIAIPSTISQALQKIKTNKYDILVTDAEVFYEDNTSESYWKTGPINLRKMVIHNQWLISNLFSKKIWNTVGGFSTTHTFPREDYLFWTKCIASGASVGYINKPGIRYRRKAANSRNKKRRSYADRLHLYRALHPFQQKIIKQHFNGAEQKELSAVADAKLGYYEYQSGQIDKGWKLLTQSFQHHPDQGHLLTVFLKTPFKRVLKNWFGKEV